MLTALEKEDREQSSDHAEGEDSAGTRASGDLAVRDQLRMGSGNGASLGGFEEKSTRNMMRVTYRDH
jgi:hypothetical protein